MRRVIASILIAAILLAVPTAVSAAPPPRPLDVTPSQFNELQKLEADPQHVAVLDVHASYKSEHEKQLEATLLSNDILTVVFSGGYPTLVLVLLIMAAPL
jgi:hypothetical protein